MIPYAPDYEKAGTPIIGIEDLNALGQIVQRIKARIESTEYPTYSVGVSSGAVGSHEVIGQVSCQDTKKQI